MPAIFTHSLSYWSGTANGNHKSCLGHCRPSWMGRRGSIESSATTASSGSDSRCTSKPSNRSSSDSSKNNYSSYRREISSGTRLVRAKGETALLRTMSSTSLSTLQQTSQQHDSFDKEPRRSSAQPSTVAVEEEWGYFVDYQDEDHQTLR